MELMLLGAVFFLSFIMPFLAGAALRCREGHSVPLFTVAIAAGVALTVLALVLSQGWTARMEHFDFAAIRNARLDPGKFPELSALSIYFLPYEAALFGAIASGELGWTLYRRLRYGL